MLSGRAWFERFPRQLRRFVALLAMLSLVAPSWHICSLGGHAASMNHSAGKRMIHGMQFPRSASGAFICYCRPRIHADHSDTSKFHFSARMTMEHDPSCLAALLGAMPALLASPVRLSHVTTLLVAAFAIRRDFPARQFIRTICGRGPPVDLAFAQ